MYDKDCEEVSQHIPMNSAAKTSVVFSSFGSSTILWNKNDPDGFVKFKRRYEKSGTLYKETPFKNGKFVGWGPAAIAEFVDNWLTCDLMA